MTSETLRCQNISLENAAMQTLGRENTISGGQYNSSRWLKKQRKRRTETRRNREDLLHEKRTKLVMTESWRKGELRGSSHEKNLRYERGFRTSDK